MKPLSHPYTEMRCDTENDRPGIKLAVECFERTLYTIYCSKLSPQVLSKRFNLKLPRCSLVRMVNSWWPNPEEVYVQ